MNNGISSSNHAGVLLLAINSATRQLHFGSSNGSTSNIATFNNNYALMSGWWYYITISYKDNTASLFINGVHMVDRMFYPLNNSTAHRIMHFGGFNDTSNPSSDKASVVGKFDNIVVHNKAITASNAYDFYMAEIHSQGTMNINDIKKTDKLAVYPNPVKNILNMVSDVEIMEVKVFNMLGQLQNITRNDNQLSLGHLKPGTYVMNVLLKDHSTKSIKINKE